MKTHPDSIFVKLSDIADLGIDGSGHLWGTNEDVSNRSNVTEFVPAAAYTDLKTRLEKAEFSENGFESLYDAAHKENELLKSRVATALDTILRFGGIGGDHHKAWVIDQTVRALTVDGYDKWVDDYKGDTDQDGEREYDWYEGIAP